MRKSALFRYGLFVLLALPIGFVLLYPQLIRCLWIDRSSNFQLLEQAPQVYIHRSTTPRQRWQLWQHVARAQHRIQQFWGDQRGKAILIYCPDQADYEQFCAGGEGAGCSIGLPWGASYLVLGPEGNNTDVIAHELCHDELFARLDWWQIKRQIPQWFNEGLALMVDYRFTPPTSWEHPDSAQTNQQFRPETGSAPRLQHPLLKLTDLETTRDFFGGNYTHTMLAYRTAADEVTRWLSVVGRAGVPALTDAITQGATFDEAYSTSGKKRK